MHLGEVTSDLTEEFLFLFLIFILSKMKGIKTVVISSLSTQIDGCKCLTSTLSHSTKLYFFFASSDTPDIDFITILQISSRLSALSYLIVAPYRVPGVHLLCQSFSTPPQTVLPVDLVSYSP